MGHRSEVFPIPDSDLALRFWAVGNALNHWDVESTLLASEAFLQEQINLHGEDTHPLSGGLEYDSGAGLEILIMKQAQDPEGLQWYELQDVITGLWAYIVTGMQYCALKFDILDIEDHFQIGYGHILKRDGASLSKRLAKRELQITSPGLPSSANSIPGRYNSSLAQHLAGGRDWPIEDSDLTLKIVTRGPDLDEEALRDLFRGVIQIVQNAIAAKGKDALLGGSSFHSGRLVILEVINEPLVLTWEQLGYVVLGLIDYMIDYHMNREIYFTIFQGDPKVELAIGKVTKGFVQHDNVTVARRNAADRDEVY